MRGTTINTRKGGHCASSWARWRLTAAVLPLPNGGFQQHVPVLPKHPLVPLVKRLDVIRPGAARTGPRTRTTTGGYRLQSHRVHHRSMCAVGQRSPSLRPWCHSGSRHDGVHQVVLLIRQRELSTVATRAVSTGEPHAGSVAGVQDGGELHLVTVGSTSPPRTDGGYQLQSPRSAAACAGRTATPVPPARPASQRA